MEAVADNKNVVTFRVRGMDCAEETEALRREVGPVVGGAEHLGFNILQGTMTVHNAALKATPGAIVEAVKRAGMRAEMWDAESNAMGDERVRTSRTILTIASGALGLAGFVSHAVAAGGVRAALGSEGTAVAHQVPLLSCVIYGAAIVVGAYPVAPKAWLAARRLRPDMNLLMIVAISGAAAIGEWFEAASVTFLFSLSLALESWSIGRARRAVRALMDLSTPMALLKRANQADTLVPVETVAIGDTFIVRPGERIPLDGLVTAGNSDVNQAPITGESTLVSKEAGGVVFAGTINGNGALEVKSTKRAGETTLAHIIKMVGEAQHQRAPTEQWVDRFARVYTPSVMGIAALVLLVPVLILHQPFTVWLYRSLVLLVIACPCALVISTPVSIVAALAAAARHGVLVKGGRGMEAPAALKAMAYDKTGTLTVGRPVVSKVVSLGARSDSDVLALAASMEVRSDHPLANAIVTHAREKGVSVLSPDAFELVLGKGARGVLNGERYWLGSHRFLEELGHETTEIHRLVDELSSSGNSVVVIGTDREVIGVIVLADAPRPEARASLEELRKLGVEHHVMLTGDNRSTAEAIAKQVGVDEVIAELLPEDKVRAVEQLVSKFGRVAMVGDGVNDAPALARATLGIAMGAIGSDAALETADIALMSDDLAKLSWLVRHARRTIAIIRQNILFSLAVKGAVLALTVLGHATLWMAIAADMGASLIVIGNGLRLLRSRERSQSGPVESLRRGGA